jgi:CRP/FNR family transcriptional regulator
MALAAPQLASDLIPASGSRSPHAKGGNGSAAAVRCSSCGLTEACMSCSLEDFRAGASGYRNHLRRRVRRAERLYRTGDAFNSIYSVHSGSIKTLLMLDDGREQVAGFHMAGEMLGMDGIALDYHGCDAVALEDSEVCAIPYNWLAGLGSDANALQRLFHKALSREIVRENAVMMMLGTMHAEERLAMFLLDLSRRLAARGYSASEFVLRMTREELGSYLGLKIETVSRLFHKFQDEGLISVRQKHIDIRDLAALQNCLGRSPHHGSRRKAAGDFAPGPAPSPDSTADSNVQMSLLD